MAARVIALSRDQSEALDDMARWFSGCVKHSNYGDFYTLTGAAGTGKSTLVARLMDRLGIRTDQILALAISAIAVQNIKEKTNAGRAETIAQFIKCPQPRIKMTDNRGTVLATFTDLFTLISYLKAELYPAYVMDSDRAEFQKLVASLVSLQTGLKSKKQTGYDPLLDVDTEALGRLIPRYRFIHETEFMARNGGNRMIDGVRLIVIDEVGMVSEEDIVLLERLASSCKIPVLGLGDSHQLAPVSGRLNHYITKKPSEANTWELTTIHRQDTGSYLFHLAGHLRQGENLVQAFAAIGGEAAKSGETVNDVVPFNYRDLEASGRLADMLCRADCVLTYTNRDVKTLTRFIRRYLFDVSWQNVINFDSTVQPGDKIMITVNESVLKDDDGKPITDSRLVNGLTGRIVRIRAANAIAHLPKNMAAIARQTGLVSCDVLFDSGELITGLWLNTASFDDPHISPTFLRNQSDFSAYNRLYYRFDKALEHLAGHKRVPDYVNTEHPQILYATFGYVLTVHKAQGREWNSVIYYEDASHRPNPHTAQLMPSLRYTAVTRSKKYLAAILKSA